MTVAEASATTAVVVADVPDGYTRQEATPVAYTIAARRWFNVEIQREQDGYTVVDRDTGIFGHGDDASAALRDFQRAVVEHLDVLERQESLSDELAAQLEYLRTRLR